MKYEKQLQAKELRKSGKSINQIADTLNVSRSTVSLWVRNIILTEQQKIQLLNNKSNNFKDNFSEKKKIDARLIRKQYQEEGKIQAKKGELLHCMGCMLHWAEGAKNKNVVSFTNSDVHMLKLFVSFLKKYYNVSSEQISLNINCFLNKEADIENNVKYWIQELDIHGCKINQHTIKLITEPINNFGVCRICICSTRIAQQIYGAIQEYSGFSNDLCLENKRTRTK